MSYDESSPAPRPGPIGRSSSPRSRSRPARCGVDAQRGRAARGRRRVELRGALRGAMADDPGPALCGRRASLGDERVAGVRSSAGHRDIRAPARCGPLDDEIAQLRAGGSHVRLLFPDDASSEALVRKPLNPSRRAAAAEAGYAQGTAMAPAVGEWLRSRHALVPEVDVEDLAARFAVPSLRKAEWTHVAHLAVGAWHVRPLRRRRRARPPARRHPAAQRQHRRRQHAQLRLSRDDHRGLRHAAGRVPRHVPAGSAAGRAHRRVCSTSPLADARYALHVLLARAPAVDRRPRAVGRSRPRAAAARRRSRDSPESVRAARRGLMRVRTFAATVAAIVVLRRRAGRRARRRPRSTRAPAIRRDGLDGGIAAAGGQSHPLLRRQPLQVPADAVGLLAHARAGAHGAGLARHAARCRRCRAPSGRDLDAVTFTPIGGATPMTWAAAFDANYTDGIVVLHRGRVVYERYAGALAPERQHIAFSVTKSFVATLAGILIADGTLDDRATVASYVPELQQSGFGDATVRQLLDMTTGLDYSEDYADDDSPVWNLGRAVGFLPAPPDYRKPATTYAYLASLGKAVRARRALLLQDPQHRRAGVGAAAASPAARWPSSCATGSFRQARRRAGRLLPRRPGRRRVRRRRPAPVAARPGPVRRDDAPRRPLQRRADRAEGVRGRRDARRRPHPFRRRRLQDAAGLELSQHVVGARTTPTAPSPRAASMARRSTSIRRPRW